MQKKKKRIVEAFFKSQRKYDIPEDFFCLSANMLDMRRLIFQIYSIQLKYIQLENFIHFQYVYCIHFMYINFYRNNGDESLPFVRCRM